MKMKKVMMNQTEKTKNLCLILFLFIILWTLLVFYVNAAETSFENERTGCEETRNGQESAIDGETLDSQESAIDDETWGGQGDVVEAALFGTDKVTRQYNEKLRIRMANEDAIQVAHREAKGTVLSEKEYNILTRIVEAEAGNMNKKSKILVANVILNRMEHDEFPDTVEEVVFQNVNGAVQFSPIADGRYYSVQVAESTKESVDRALAGEDYSEGALYFMERSMSASGNVKWFDECLTKLFKYESHEFFK